MAPSHVYGLVLIRIARLDKNNTVKIFMKKPFKIRIPSLIYKALLAT